MRKAVFTFAILVIVFFAFVGLPVREVSPYAEDPFHDDPFTKTIRDVRDFAVIPVVYGDAPTTTHQTTHTPTCGRGAAMCGDCLNDAVCGAEEKCAEQCINWKIIYDTSESTFTWYWEAWANGCMESKYYPTAIGTIGCFVDPMGLVPCVRPEHNVGSFIPSKNPSDLGNGPIERTSQSATASYHQGGGTDSLQYTTWFASISAGHSPALKLRVGIVHVECEGCEPEQTHQDDHILMIQDMIVID